MRTCGGRSIWPIKCGNIFKTILMMHNKVFLWTDDKVESILWTTMSYISIKRMHMDCKSCQSSSTLYILYFPFFYKVPFQNKPLWSPFCKAPISADLAKTGAKFCIFTQTKRVNVEVVNKQIGSYKLLSSGHVTAMLILLVDVGWKWANKEGWTKA